MDLWSHLNPEEYQALGLLYGEDARHVLDADRRVFCLFRDRVIWRMYQEMVTRQGIQRTLEQLGDEFCTTPSNVRNIIHREESLLELAEG